VSAPSLSIFFPCYNDAPTIAGLVRAAVETARGLTEDFEVLVVDDGSEDDSVAVLRRLNSELSEFRLIEHGENRGYGAALRSGFENCGKELVFYTDGDGQYDPRELPLLIGLLAPEVDVVNGWDRVRPDPWYRVLIGALYNRIVSLAFGIRIRDVQCDFRLIRRSALPTRLESDTGTVCVELVRRLQDGGARFREVPVTRHPRPHGRSQFFTPVRLLRSAGSLPRLWWRLRAGPGPIS